LPITFEQMTANNHHIRSRNIYLIGYRCTGKTSTGKTLATRLGWAFLDMDVNISHTYGMTIAEIVSKNGWDDFREKERAVMQDIAVRDHCVVATGGGVVLNQNNVSDMKKTGVVVWLKARPETIKQRMEKDYSTNDFRPSLSSKDVLAEVEDILGSRSARYRQAMDFCIDTDAKDINSVCDLIIKHLDPSLK